MSLSPADKCVLDSCRYMQQRGWDVTYLPVNKDGLIDMDQLKDAIREDTAIVSVMYVNNEIGEHHTPLLKLRFGGKSCHASLFAIVCSLPVDSWLTLTCCMEPCAGVVQPMAEIGKLCRERKVFFHTDAAQAVGKIPVDVNADNIDLMSISAHKIYGPKGIGALYVRRRPRVRLEAQMSGGGQVLIFSHLDNHLLQPLIKCCRQASKVLDGPRMLTHSP